MEEPNDLPSVWICSSDVWAFVPIAMKTGEREIFNNSLASMLTCDDVIDVKGQGIEVDGNVTILASALGPLPDLPDNFLVHE